MLLLLLLSMALELSPWCHCLLHLQPHQLSLSFFGSHANMKIMVITVFLIMLYDMANSTNILAFSCTIWPNSQIWHKHGKKYFLSSCITKDLSNKTYYQNSLDKSQKGNISPQHRNINLARQHLKDSFQNVQQSYSNPQCKPLWCTDPKGQESLFGPLPIPQQHWKN